MLLLFLKQNITKLAKAKHNAEYLAKLDKSFKQFEEGKTISFSMEELREMESENWKPTQKVLDWMNRVEQGNQ